MNHDDHLPCVNCGTANPIGSRFCNSCGHVLPDSDEIVCANCHVHNPKSNIYCDNCGSRLIQETIDSPTSSEDPQPHPAPSTSMLNLPIRDEGHTGDLDLNDLPDWLRTGDVPNEAEPSPPAKLPRPSELTPEERPETADLPDWLLNEADSNSPIIDTPADISTERFMDFMEGSNQDEVDELSLFAADDPRLEEAESDLPSWLKEDEPLAPLGSELETDAEDEDVPDWLAAPNLIGSKDDDDASGQSGETDFLASELAGWMDEQEDLAEQNEESEADQAEESFDWLTDLSDDDASSGEEEIAEEASELDWLHAGTRFFDDSETAVSKPESESSPADDSLDWLRQGTSFLDDDATSSDASPTEESTTDADSLDWLTQGTTLFGDEDQTAAEEPDADTNADWLNELAGESTAEPTDDVPEAEGQLDSWLIDSQDDSMFHTDEEADKATDLPDGFDWLSELEDEPDSAAATQPGSVDAATDLGAANIFADLGEDAASNETADGFDWLNELDDGLTADNEPETAVVDDLLADDGAFDWLNEEMEESPDAARGEPNPTSSEPVDGNDDWLSTLDGAEDIVEESGLAVPEEIVTGELPDWLSELGPPGTGSLSESGEALEETFSDFFTADLQDEALPDWLSDAQNAQAEPAGNSGTGDTGSLIADLDWLTDEADDSSRPETAVSSTTDGEPILADGLPAEDTDWQDNDNNNLAADPDWLSALEGLDESVFDPEIEAALDAADKPTAEADELPAEETSHALAYDFTQSELASEDELPNDDSWLTTSEVGDELSQSDLPDWLSELGDTDSESSAAEEAADDPDLPDWINTMKPGETPQPSQYESIFDDTEDFSDLTGSEFDFGEELAGDTLPDWLQTPTDSVGAKADGNNGQRSSSSTLDDPFADEEEIAEDVSAEITSVLADMPPPPEIEKAEIPEWVLAMKPADSGSGDGGSADGQPIQRTGPLAGIRGVVAIEPEIAMPRSSELPLAELAVTDAQQQQVALVRQLAQAEAKPLRVAQAEQATQSSPILRLVVGLLLLAAIVLALLGVSLLPMATRPLSTSGEAALATLDEAAGEPILIVFDYPPAYSGELQPLARSVLQRGAANGSPLLTISQLPSGTGLAEAETAVYETTSLGLLPGGAAGLRQLATCLNNSSDCPLLLETIAGGEANEHIDQVGTIVLLTSERDSLINWIEQVGTATHLPLVTATTEALAPLVAPYAASEQVAGVWAGLPDAVALQAAIDAPDEELQQQLIGRTMGQLVALLVVVAGLLFYGFRRPATGGNG